MTRAQAVSLGHALDVESPAAGVVHSVFVHAVNLTIRGDLWTLLCEGKGDLPFGIRVARPSFDCLGLRSGDAVRVRSGFVSLGTRLVVDCRAAPRWTHPAEAEFAPGLLQRLARIAQATCGRSWPESRRMADAVRASMDDAAALREVLAGVVGRGPGATPSGDDVLIGILAVLTSPHSGPAGARATETLRRSLLPLLPTTTDISGHLLRQAAAGLFSRDVHELRSALIGETRPCGFPPLPPALRGERARGEGGRGPSPDPEFLGRSPAVLWYAVPPSPPASLPPQSRGERGDEALCRVLQTGATSGADTCEGLLAFAPFYFTKRRDRVSA